MVFNYHFGGVAISSDVPLTSLRPAQGGDPTAPMIHVTAGTGPAPVEEKMHFAWDGRFRMRLGEAGGEWLMGTPWGMFQFTRDASVVRIFGLDGPDATILKDLFARRLLPRLIKLKGGATYHAASLAKDGRGVLIMGRSGAGKSTMAVGLAMRGAWEILGDDMALVWGDDAERIAPAARDVTIWPHSCAGLGLADDACRTLDAYDGKRAFEPQRTERLEPVPLAGLFFLDRGDYDAPELQRCSHKSAFEQALKQVIFFNPSGPAADERVQSVTRLNRLLGRIPAWTLTYPASFSALDAVSETIASAVQDG